MTRKAKIILGVALASVLLGAVVIALGIWTVFSFINNSGIAMTEEVPPDLREPRILKGENFLRKEEIFKKVPLSTRDLIIKAAGISDEEERQRFTEAETDKRFWGFSDLRVCGNDIVAVGRFGGYRLDSAGSVKETLYFEPRVDEIKILFWKQKHSRQTLDDLRILDVEGDGQCEYVSQSSVDGVAFFDAKGRVTWRYGERLLGETISNVGNDDDAWITGVDFGDLDDDGKQDFVISKKADGIRAFRANQQEIWFQPDAFPTSDFRFIDTDGDGKQELVELQGAGSNLRDKRSGAILHGLELDGGTDGIFETSDEKGRGAAQVFEISENRLVVKDFKTSIVSQSDAPLSEVRKSAATGDSKIDESYVSDTESVYKPKGHVVRLHAGIPGYLVVLASFISIPRTNLYVYGPGGQFLYHELLDEDAEAMCVTPNPDGTEGFIVGGKDTVWKYVAN